MTGRKGKAKKEETGMEAGTGKLCILCTLNLADTYTLRHFSSAVPPIGTLRACRGGTRSASVRDLVSSPPNAASPSRLDAEKLRAQGQKGSSGPLSPSVVGRARGALCTRMGAVEALGVGVHVCVCVLSLGHRHRCRDPRLCGPGRGRAVGLCSAARLRCRVCCRGLSWAMSWCHGVM